MKLIMKKWSLLLLTVLMMPFAVSCGDDKEKSDVITDGELISRAIGTWMCTQSIDTKNGQSYQGLMVGKEVTINANGTFTSTAESFGYTGTYSVSGNTITAKNNNGGTFVFSVSFNGKRMVWEGTANNGVSFKYTFDQESDNKPQELDFTEKMIAGDFSWTVKDFSFEKGSNSNIQKGKSIRFKTDGTCEGFHTMEDAWRINNGKIETFFKQTNEPMFVYTLLSQKDSIITVRMNGTLDNDLIVKITLSREDVVNYQDNTEDMTSTVHRYSSMCYDFCSSFAGKQFFLEQMRITSSTDITPSSSIIQETWYNAYQTISGINYLLENTEQITNGLPNQEGKHIIAEMRGLRAFIYYNIAMLWGDVPLITTTMNPDNSYYPQSSQNEIYMFAYNEIMDALANLSESNRESSDKYILTRDAGFMLKAEIEMTLGNYPDALNSINQIDVSNYVVTRGINEGTPGSTVIWGLKLSETNAFYPIYTLNNGQLFLDEASGKTEGLERNWQSFCSNDYGYWAALKRLGKAQQVTGCSDYQLLMPIPSSEIARNPYLKQNAGY